MPGDYTVAGGEPIVGLNKRIGARVYCELLCLHQVGTEHLGELPSSQVVLAQTGALFGGDRTVKRLPGGVPVVLNRFPIRGI